MAITTTTTAANILNTAAAEAGIAPVADPYASDDKTFQQMRYLLNTAGVELCLAHPWEFLVSETTINSALPDQETFDLPDDFYYIIPQTGWSQSQRIPLGGPLTAQEWTYLKGRDLAQNTLYSSFRLFDGKIGFYPAPPETGFEFTYEYISKNWVIDADDNTLRKDEVTKAGDKPLFDKTLISRYLKLKYLESANFDTNKAQGDFNQIFDFLTGKDKSGKVLNAGNYGAGYRYISIWNAPDTGYGTP